jgi:hypothetical protein
MTDARLKVRLSRENGCWQVSVRKGVESAAQAAWLSLGGSGDVRVALRLWLALVGGGGRR